VVREENSSEGRNRASLYTGCEIQREGAEPRKTGVADSISHAHHDMIDAAGIHYREQDLVVVHLLRAGIHEASRGN